MATLNEIFYEKLIEKTKSFHEFNGGHGFDHVERVYNNATRIYDAEKVSRKIDGDVVKTSALLHDIAREREAQGIANCHAEEGAEMCRDVLSELEFPSEKIDDVSYVISVHRYSTGVKPNTVEAKILQDADRLDALGAIIIGRIFEFGGKKGRLSYNPEEDPDAPYISGEGHSSITHFYRKILKIKPEKFHTKTAQEIARGRYDFVKEFVDRYVKEWNGEL